MPPWDIGCEECHIEGGGAVKAFDIGACGKLWCESGETGVLERVVGIGKDEVDRFIKASLNE